MELKMNGGHNMKEGHGLRLLAMDVLSFVSKALCNLFFQRTIGNL